MEAKPEYGRRRGRGPGQRPAISETEEPPEPNGDVVYEPRPVQCPQCKSEITHIYHTNSKVRPKKRYRICKDCGQRFQTLQK